MKSASDRPLRILLIAPSLDIVGGQAVQAAHLLSSLRREPSLTIDFQPIDPRLPGPLRWLQSLKFLRTIVTSLLYCSQLLCRVPRYHLLHAFSAGKSSYTLRTIPVLLISRLYRKKFVLNYHDGRAEEHLTNWRTARLTIRMADLVVSPSDYVVGVFAAHGIPARCIYNSIDPSVFIYRRRRDLRPVFLTNRSLEPVYNVGCLLRAFAIIQQRYPDATLTIAHDGVCRPALERLARDLGLRHTRFIGCVPYPRIPELYDSADIYLTSPNVDCMPLSLLECFASGLPVIATAVGGIPYIVTHEHNGLLVPVNDHEAMAAAAIRLLEDPELVERLTQNARAKLERYSEDCVRREWFTAYQELISR